MFVNRLVVLCSHDEWANPMVSRCQLLDGNTLRGPGETELLPGTLLSPSSQNRFQWSATGRKALLYPIITEEMFMIGREALQNAFQHAEAENVALQLVYTNRALTLRIADNGKGLVSGELTDGKEGHWGLSGMRERAARIGGRLPVDSHEGGGCTVTVVVSANVASIDHVSSAVGAWFSRLRSFFAPQLV